MKEELRKELLSLIHKDDQVREDLAKDGSLFEGYHPQMEAIHKRNTARLKEIIERLGWPTISKAGKDGAEAAWRIVQHAIGDPDFQRTTLKLMKQCAEEEDAVELWQIALLEDRIRFLEGKDQLYGTSFDWDENGQMSPSPPIEDPENVDARRARMGLQPLHQAIEEKRSEVVLSGEKPPTDHEARRKKMEEWARSAGWR